MIIIATTPDANPDTLQIAGACDGCQRRQPLPQMRPGENRVSALLALIRTQLHERGWTRRVRHGQAHDLCPTCRRIEPRD